jgi:peptide/nickel transport system permease protein
MLLNPKLRYASIRLLQGLFVVFGAVTISFILVHLTGDPAAVIAGGQLSLDQVRVLSHQLGYDRPLLVQYLSYLAGLVHGDLGSSIRYQTPALDIVAAALPNTLVLVACSIGSACAIAIPTALFSVLHRESLFDRALRRFLIVLQGIPEYWAAMMLVLVFAVGLRWLPSFGFGGPSSLILPTIALATPMISSFVRLLRATLLDVMGSDFVLSIRSKGISDTEIVLRHGFRNVLPAFLTLLALYIGWLVGGTLIIETIFVWPGVGTVLVNAVKVRDLPVIQAVVIIIAITVVILNLVVDLLILAIDPRVRLGSR